MKNKDFLLKRVIPSEYKLNVNRYRSAKPFSLGETYHKNLQNFFEHVDSCYAIVIYSGEDLKETYIIIFFAGIF